LTSRAIACAVALAIAGCGGDEKRPERPAPPGEERIEVRERPEPRLRRARCPEGAANCRAAAGRIVYVEAVDPDGDGDAHFVLATRNGLSGPGITVIDVAKELRPRPLPGVGGRISAAGPVYRGSYGQSQIQATELHVAR
jgi:hypothetical protein